MDRNPKRGLKKEQNFQIYSAKKLKRSTAKHLKSICVKHFCFARRRRSTFRHSPPTPISNPARGQSCANFSFCHRKSDSIPFAGRYVCLFCFAGAKWRLFCLNRRFGNWIRPSFCPQKRLQNASEGFRSEKFIYIKNRGKYTKTLSHTRAVFGNRKRSGFFEKKGCIWIK